MIAKSYLGYLNKQVDEYKKEYRAWLFCFDWRNWDESWTT